MLPSGTAVAAGRRPLSNRTNTEASSSGSDKLLLYSASPIRPKQHVVVSDILPQRRASLPVAVDNEITLYEDKKAHQIQFLSSIHHPHQLEPIKEQASYLSLCPDISKHQIFSQAASSVRVQHRLQKDESRRRKLSFSLNDILTLPYPVPGGQSSLQRARSSASSSHSSALAVSPLNYPKEPIFAAPGRRPTPQGLPRFNTEEAESYRLPRPNVSAGPSSEFGTGNGRQTT